MSEKILTTIFFVIVSVAVSDNIALAMGNDEGRNLGTTQWTVIDAIDFQDVDRTFESLAPIVETNQIELITHMLEGAHKEVSTGSDAVRRLSDTKIEVFSRYAVASELRPLAEDLFVRFANDRLETFRLDRQSDAGYYIPMLVMRLNRQIDSDSNAVLYEQFLKTINIVRDRSKVTKAFDLDYYVALNVYEALGVVKVEEEADKEIWKNILNDERSSSLMFTSQLLTVRQLWGKYTKDFYANMEILSRTNGFHQTRWKMKSIFPRFLDKAVGTVQTDPSPKNYLWSELERDPAFLEHVNYVDAETGVGFPMYAYCANKLRSLEKLAEMGADFDSKLKTDVFDIAKSIYLVAPESSFSPRKGDTILLAAALDPFRKDDFIPIVLKYTKDPDQRDLLNRNALHRILYHRMGEHQANLVKLLIEAGTDVNSESVSGNTPAHVAVYRNSHLLPLLIEAGADLTKKNQRGETPVDLLRRSVKEKWIFHEESVTVLKSLEDKIQD